jgi:short-subunit dehydrogenase
MELAPQGVKVVYVEPGAVRTEFFDRSASAARVRSDAVSDRYAQATAAARAAMKSSPSSPVEDVVRRIERGLLSRLPKARYVVGVQARTGLATVSHLSACIRDQIMRQSMGLRPDMLRQDV